jgi:hypothetical protein
MAFSSQNRPDQRPEWKGLPISAGTVKYDDDDRTDISTNANIVARYGSIDKT